MFLSRESKRYDNSYANLFGVKLFITLFLPVLILVLPRQALCATAPKAVTLKPIEIFERAAGSTLVLCGKISGRWVAGVNNRDGRFVSNSETLKALQKNLKKARTKKLKAALTKSVAAAQRKGKKEAPTCRSGPDLSATPTPISEIIATPTPGIPATATPTLVPGVTPTITPTPSATATRTPTPTSAGCYNGAGDTQCFGIPSANTGNITRGLNLFQSYCYSCHAGSPRSEPRNRSFEQVLISFISVPQMSLYQGAFTSAQVADLVAYLNRVNPNQ